MLNIVPTKQSWARGNVAATTCSCFQASTLSTVYSLWLLHLHTKTLEFFLFFLRQWSAIPLLCCRVVVVAKLKHCRVPSTAKKALSCMGMSIYMVSNILTSAKLLLKPSNFCAYVLVYMYICIWLQWVNTFGFALVPIDAWWSWRWVYSMWMSTNVVQCPLDVA